jgi:BirA family transcriptional regulator, biotin operon repressor / biotin---[acetyl-CoA-carboxylase] ligase
MNDPNTDDARALDTRVIGLRALIYERLDSTNTLALSFGNDPTQHGLVVLAREQTAGRGQYGRTWQAPPGSSVLMSVLLFPPPALRRPAVLTAWAAVAVCQTISIATNLHATIKWPNDVLIGGKKVCGILIEQRTTGHLDSPLAAVVGIGLNVGQSSQSFEQAGLPLAASLTSVSGKFFTHEDVAAALIRQLDGDYQRFLDGGPATLEASWNLRLDLVGKSVLIEAVNAQHRGWVRELTLDRLDLETPNGEVVRLILEAIRHVHVAD